MQTKILLSIEQIKIQQPSNFGAESHGLCYGQLHYATIEDEGISVKVVISRQFFFPEYGANEANEANDYAFSIESPDLRNRYKLYANPRTLTDTYLAGIEVAKKSLAKFLKKRSKRRAELADSLKKANG